MGMAILIGAIVPIGVVALAVLCGWYWANWADSRDSFGIGHFPTPGEFIRANERVTVETLFGLPIVEVDDLGVEDDVVLGPLTAESLDKVAAELRREYRSVAKWRAHPDVIAFAALRGMTVQELMDELERLEEEHG